MKTMRALISASTMLLTVGLTAAPSSADNDLPLHHVKYTVTAKKPIYAEIYYLDHEPALFADWSHNPYEFMPNVEADLGPGQTWTYELDLRKPEEWATVIANTGGEPGSPDIHCEVSVDGVVTVAKDGAKGVVCSTRQW